MFEIPEVKKCCFYFPLRFGLLVWACVKLIVYLVLLFHTINYLIWEYQRGIYYNRLEFIVALIVTILATVDFVFLGIFVVSVYKKEATKARLVYLESLGFLIFCVLIFATVTLFIFSGLAMWYAYIALKIWSFFFFTIIVQLYFVILMKSEVLKLERNFQSVNPTIESDAVKNSVNV